MMGCLLKGCGVVPIPLNSAVDTVEMRVEM